MTRARLSVSLALAAFGAGCIAFVDQSPTGDRFSTTCALADQTSACGACIAASCANELSACCGDPVCRRELGRVDECADAGICVFDMSNAAAGALGKCIDTCGACNAQPATSGEAGAPVTCSLNAPLGYCFCDTGSSSNPTRCDVTTVPNAVCCADIDWPSAGTCTCSTVKCDSQTTGCMCSTSASGTTGVCDQSVGTCCANDSFCTCDTGIGQCDQFTSPVSDCRLPQSVGCNTSQRQVNNCSPTAN